MNFIDIILGALLIWGLIRGFMKGFFASLASLIALIAGLYIAVHFSDVIGSYLFGKGNDPNTTTNKLIAFAVTFVVVIILVTFAGKVLTKIADFASLGIVNKLLGAAFGVLKFAFIASVIIMLLDAAKKITPLIQQKTIDASVLYQPVQQLAPLILPKLLQQEHEKQKNTIEI